MAGPEDEKTVGDSKETPDATSNVPASPAVEPEAVSSTPEEQPAGAAEATSEPVAEADTPHDEGADGDDEVDDNGNPLVSANDAAAPPAPPLDPNESAPLFDQHPWAVTARVLAISSLLGLAVSAWAQLSIKAAWVPDFLQNNTRGVPERKLMLVLLVAGLAVGAATGAGLL